MAPPRIALHASHPAQVWVLKALADELAGEVDILWYVRNKDITVELAKLLGLQFTIMSDAKTGLLYNALELLTGTLNTLAISRRQQIDLWVSKHSAVHIASTLLRHPSLVFNDDDVDAIPLLAWTGFPFTSAILVPDVIRMGRFESKSVRIPSHFELMYLHPNRFSPDPSIYSELGLQPGARFSLVRLSALKAHHDRGVTGVTTQLLRSVLAACRDADIRVFITSEKPLEAEFEPYRLAVSPIRIHHALAYSQFLLSDSQTMTSEAALLGTPAYRVSDFVGKLSAIDAIEQLGLAFGYRGEECTRPLADLGRYISQPNGKKHFASLHADMLKKRIDPLPIFAGLVRALISGLSVNEARRTVTKDLQLASQGQNGVVAVPQLCD